MSPPNSHPSRSNRSGRWVLILVVAACALAAWGIASRIYDRSKLRKDTEAAAVTTVTTVQVAASNAAEGLTLPGNIDPYVSAPIYAQTSGYLKQWYADIGSTVKKGQVLAEIDTPEVDQQLRQAKADLGTANAHDQLAQTTAERWKKLLTTDSVSRQDVDDRVGNAAATRAELESAQANVSRLEELEGFKRVRAPFDGVVTARNVDIGALISVGGASQPELFHVMDTRKLRVYVQVPQSYAAQIRPGLQASVSFADHPGQNFPARLVRTAKAIDTTQRTLLAEFQADNSQGALLTGGYAEVHLELPAAGDTLRVPANVLIFRSEGPQAARLDSAGKVTLVPIRIGRDFGQSVEVVQGLSAGDIIVANPPDSLINGQTVHVVEPPSAAQVPAK